jgi:hypothetical protein
VTEDQTTGMSPFDLTLDPTQFTTDSAPFLGVVVVDQAVAGGTVTNDDGSTRETGPQWQYCVRPVDYVLRGDTGAYSTWVTPTTKKNSKINAIVTAMSKLPAVFPKTMRPAQGQLNGIVCWWVRRDMEFGRNLARNVLIPIREATEEEIERAQAMLQEVGSPSGNSGEGADYTTEQHDELVSFFNGKTADAASLAAAKARNMDADLRADILSGKALKTLLGSGDLELSADGTIVSTEEDAA